MAGTALTIALERCEFLPIGRATDDGSILTLRNLVFEPLCRWREGGVEPGLLTSWTHDEVGRAWRFALRPGAMFHDGKPCVAEDIVAAIRATMDELDLFGMPWPYARYLAGARIEASRGAVLIAAPEPLADLPEVLTEFFVVRAAPDGAAVLGTGPYRVVAHEARRVVELAAVNPAHAPSRLILRAIPNADDRYAALRSGEADVATNLERMHVPARADDDLAWGQAANTLSVMCYLNAAAGTFAAPAARRAINLAVDRRAILDALFGGLGLPANTVVSPFHFGHREAVLPSIPHDPIRARALFAEAGAAPEILLRTPLHMPEHAPEIMRMVAEQLGRVGIAARIETEADRPLYARQVGERRIGDVAMFDSSPHSTFRVLDDKISSRVRGQWWQGHDDPALEPMILAANRTMDDAARAVAYARCLRQLQMNPPWLYLFHPVLRFAARKTVTGVSLDAIGMLRIGA